MKRGDYMYNRYIPNEQGGFERVRMTPSGEDKTPLPVQEPSVQNVLQPLRKLLPGGMDTGDLLLILIFLLVLLDAERDEVPSALMMLAAFILA